MGMVLLPSGLRPYRIASRQRLRWRRLTARAVQTARDCFRKQFARGGLGHSARVQIPAAATRGSLSLQLADHKDRYTLGEEEEEEEDEEDEDAKDDDDDDDDDEFDQQTGEARPSGSYTLHALYTLSTRSTLNLDPRPPTLNPHP